jgi:Fe2+ transport system protein B
MERHLQEQLEQVDRELELLQQASCTHPDYLAQLACVDERRDDKIKYENTLLKYQLGALLNKTVAERGQTFSQYFQEVRRLRDEALESCYRELYSLQKDRRRYGTEESATMLYTNRRAELLEIQSARNKEASILSGISRHVGFPAAPEMASLQSDEISRDLEAMEVHELSQLLLDKC